MWGVDEKLGEFADLDTVFFDENGKKIVLKDFVDRPVLLLMVYYYCPRACSIMLSSLTDMLNKITYTPGVDFKILAVSFADDEFVEHAREAKKNYMKRLKENFPENEWLFLTGDKHNVKKLTSSIGYRFTKREKHLYAHPNVLLVLAGDGKSIRYFYGLDFLPFDVGMAVAEAEKGTPGIAIKKVLTYCFYYDSKNKRYVFKTFRITGTVIILLLVIFFIFLIRKPEKKE